MDANVRGEVGFTGEARRTMLIHNSECRMENGEWDCPNIERIRDNRKIILWGLLKSVAAGQVVLATLPDSLVKV